MDDAAPEAVRLGEELVRKGVARGRSRTALFPLLLLLLLDPRADVRSQVREPVNVRLARD